MPTYTLAEDTYNSEDRPAWEPIAEDEIVEARITAIEEKVMPWKSDLGDEVRRVEFTFVIEGPENYRGRKMWGSTPTTFSTNENCKLRNWAQEILAAELPADFVLDTDDLVSTQVRAIVGQRQGKDKEGNPVTRNFVKDVLRTAQSYGGPSYDNEPF